MLGLETFVREKMNHKTTIQEQLNYIKITLGETLNILGSHITNAIVLNLKRTVIQFRGNN